MAGLKWDDYIQFINEPKHLVNPIRDVIVFDNKYMELITKTPWWLIILAYAPLVTYFFKNS
jgi:hypothetical protein